jgi:uncharacterized protein
MLRAILILLAAAVATSPAAAASFNCKKAKLPAEIAVCADPSLSTADEELARQFGPLIEIGGPDDVKAIKKEEDAWLKSRNACASDKQCIARRYQERLKQLGEWQKKIAAAAANTGAEAPAEPAAVDPNAASITTVAPTVAPATDDSGSSN